MTTMILLGQISEIGMILGIGLLVLIALVLGAAALYSRFYQKVGPDEAIVRTGWGGMKIVTANEL